MNEILSMITILFTISIICFTLYMKQGMRESDLKSREPEFNNLSDDLLKSVESQVTGWLSHKDHNFLTLREKEKTFVVTEPYEGGFNICKIILSQNYKAFTSMDEVHDFVRSLDGFNDILLTNMFQLLVSQLMISFGYERMNVIKKNVYHSASYLDKNSRKLYMKIDKDYPYFWILIYIQSILLKYDIGYHQY